MIVPAQQQFAEARRAALARMGAASTRPAVRLDRPASPKPTLDLIIRHKPTAVLSEGQIFIARIQWAAMASKMLRMEEQRNGTRAIKVQHIVKWVSDDLNIPLPALLSERRSINLVRARQLIMWLADKMTTASLPEMGRRIGGRDHTTCLHGIRKMQSIIDANELPEGFAEIIAKRMPNFHQEPTP